MPQHIGTAVLVLAFSTIAQAQETPDRAERLGRLPSELIKAKKTDSEIMEALFLASLVRIPKDQEKETVLKHVKTAANRQAGFEDVLWALTNSREFATVNGLSLEQLQQFSEKVTAVMQKK